jgi:DNA polymerase-1
MALVALVDLDITAYAASFLAEKRGPRLGKMHITKIMNKVMRVTEAESYIAFLTKDSRKENFRTDIATIEVYKGERKERPKYLHEMREHCITRWNAHVVTGIEADDAIGIQSEVQEDYVICSIDKDLRTIAGKHLLMHKNKDWEFLEIDEWRAKINFYRQILTGDAGDNIPGIPKIGEVRSWEALKDCKTEMDMFNKVRKIYHENGFTDERLLEVARLLFMLRIPIQEDGSHLWEFPSES